MNPKLPNFQELFDLYTKNVFKEKIVKKREPSEKISERKIWHESFIKNIIEGNQDKVENMVYQKPDQGLQIFLYQRRYQDYAYLAASHNQFKIAEFLLANKYGTDHYSCCIKISSCLLHLALEKDSPEILALFLKHAQNPTTQKINYDIFFQDQDEEKEQLFRQDNSAGLNKFIIRYFAQGGFAPKVGTYWLNHLNGNIKDSISFFTTEKKLSEKEIEDGREFHTALANKLGSHYKFLLLNAINPVLNHPQKKEMFKNWLIFAHPELEKNQYTISNTILLSTHESANFTNYWEKMQLDIPSDIPLLLYLDLMGEKVITTALKENKFLNNAAQKTLKQYPMLAVLGQSKHLIDYLNNNNPLILDNKTRNNLLHFLFHKFNSGNREYWLEDPTISNPLKTKLKLVISKHPGLLEQYNSDGITPMSFVDSHIYMSLSKYIEQWKLDKEKNDLKENLNLKKKSQKLIL